MNTLFGRIHKVKTLKEGSGERGPWKLYQVIIENQSAGRLEKCTSFSNYFINHINEVGDWDVEYKDDPRYGRSIKLLEPRATPKPTVQSATAVTPHAGGLGNQDILELLSFLPAIDEKLARLVQLQETGGL